MDQAHIALTQASGEAAFSSAELRIREAHHRIANDLAVVGSMVRLKAISIPATGEIDAGEAREMLLDAAIRVDAIGRLHRALCTAESGVPTAEFLHSICRDAAFVFGDDGSNVRCRVELTQDLTHEQTRSLGLLVHELVLNALKHAHPTGVAAQIDVVVGHDHQGRLAVDVSDDGVGLPESYEPTRDGGFGLRMSYELAKQMDAVLTFDSTPLGLICRVREHA